VASFKKSLGLLNNYTFHFPELPYSVHLHCQLLRLLASILTSGRLILASGFIKWGNYSGKRQNKPTQNKSINLLIEKVRDEWMLLQDRTRTL
jgi:hypothetical protein